MSRIDYEWKAGAPPAPNVYMTRRNTSKIHSVRYWDGERWHDIGTHRGLRMGSAGTTYDHPKPFKWPRPAGVPRPAWMRHYAPERIGLRKITDQSAIQWGTPYKVFDERETLAYLVNTGRLNAAWKTAYQGEMRVCFARKAGAR